MPIFHFRSGDEAITSATPLLFETKEDAINQARLALCEMAPDQLSENAMDLITIEVQDEAKQPLVEVRLIIEVIPKTIPYRAQPL